MQRSRIIHCFDAVGDKEVAKVPLSPDSQKYPSSDEI